MLFTSEIFIFYFLPIVFILYYILSFSRLAQNIWLFVMSILFYAWGEPVYVLLMLFSILINWWTCIRMEKYEDNEKNRKRVLIIACVINLLILFFFKYCGFLLTSINGLLDMELFPELTLRLPIGISFYTFQAMSYVIDVYRKQAKMEKNPFYVGLYIAFFPQLIAGPIVRYTSIAEQIRTRRSDYSGMSVGISRFMIGFTKKVLLSNNFAILADLIFNYSQMGNEQYLVPASLAWLGMIAYTMQIYFDFSAYSDMAIGLGKMFGFDFPENFNYPYYASSMQDFWKRWHISLTSWFREYLYFPLGGSKTKNTDIMIRNIFIVWMFTGIWHGAGLSFIVWGLWHFIFQLAERFFGYGQNGTHKIMMRIYTMLVVMFGWVVFRAVDLYQAYLYFMNLFALNSNGIFSEEALFLVNEYAVVIIIGIIFCIPTAPRIGVWVEKQCKPLVQIILQWGYIVGLCMLFIISLSYIIRSGYNPFIYFNF